MQSHPFVGRPVAIAALALLIVSAAAASFAVPAAPDLRAFRQPDGTTFVARLWGDEWRHGWETAEGYSILPDETTGYWYFARVGPTGELQASALRPGLDAPVGLRRGLRGRPARTAPDRWTTQGTGAGTNVVPSTGTGNMPVLLVTFSDRAATQAAAAFNTLLFGSGNSSMADYYREVSYNQFTVSAGPSGIGGWYTASNTHDYYGANVGGVQGQDAWPGDLVYEAAVAANAAGYNFAPYDQDGDCYVDNLVVVHQGGGEEFGGAPSTNIWSHSWDLSSALYFGNSHYGTYTTSSTCTANPAQKVKVNKYTIQPELFGTSTRITTMGVFAHEFGHALGLPDLYDTDYTSEGVGNWSLMAGGSWNYSGGDQGNRPAHLDPWSKWKLGWIQPRAISCSTSVSLPAVETSSRGFFGLLNGSAPYAASGEYFLVENRQQTGFDVGLPGPGLLVWHVDEGRTNNNSECYPGGALLCNSTRHYKVAVVQADNLWELEKGLDRGDNGDPYPGSTSKVTFNAASSPNSNIFAGTADGGAASGVSITSISASAATMTATLAAPGPCITSFTPTSGPVATSVGITGSGFTGTSALRFNGTTATFTVNSDTSITAPVPSGATTGPISVATALGRGSSSSSFTVTVPAPTVTSFTPTSGPIGTSVAITGTNFTGATFVRFNGTAASTFTVNSATSITATVATGTTTGTVSVTTPGGTGTSAGTFTVIPAPTVTSFTPTSGPIGTSVAITGTSFTGATFVRFNGTAASTLTVNSATSITATVATGTTTGTVSVTTPGGTGTSAGTFTVIPAPTITSFTPTSGPIGTSVGITGTSLTGATAVAFNGTAVVTFTVNSATSITATVPSGATTGTVSVTTPGGTGTSAGTFTVIPAPTITSFTPTSGPIGTSVAITGTNFTGATAVRFNGTTAVSFTVNSATSISAIVPSGATTGTLSVTTPGGTGTSAGSFTVTGQADLAITATGPASAVRGGSLVYTITVTNNGPAAAASVQVAHAAPPGLTFVSNAGACTTAFPCSLGTMPNGTQQTITTTLEVPIDYVPAPIQVSTTVSSGTGDPSPANNTAAVHTLFGTFFTLVPCRVADTRDATSPNGPPALGAGGDRTLVLAGTCGIPAGATALALNVTVTGAAASGNVRLFPTDVAMPLVSTINYTADVTRANNAIVAGSADGQVAITAHNASSGEVQLILDVTGYFE